jgi:hypothetical protein
MERRNPQRRRPPLGRALCGALVLSQYVETAAYTAD